MNVLGCRIPYAGWNDDLIVLIFLSASTSALLTIRIIWFKWWLVLDNIIIGTLKTSDNNDSSTPLLKLSDKFSAMSNGKNYSCIIKSTLKRNRV